MNRVLEREMNGMPLWLLRDYLVDLGGTAEGELRVSGNGWEADLAQMDDYHIGSLSVGRVRLVWRGDEAAQQEILPALEKKLLRAGG